jgi:hypothetical protein
MGMCDGGPYVKLLTSETEDALLVHADDVDSGGMLDVLLKTSI